ncbi:MAG: helix-turn-helix transcriptional regulator [Anaerostipes sp.]|nr:helix-turn-helix transcriptional regulator [Anaerostipes sp.]
MIDTLGSRLRQLRQSKKLRQEQVADLIGLNKSAISAYETNTRQPSYDILIRLATLYRVSTDYLLGCQGNRMIDVSNLTEAEFALITELVADMTEKNKRLEEL